MNQILYTQKDIKNIKKFFYLYISSIMIVIFLLFFSCYYFLELKNKHNLNNNLVQSFFVTKLYSDKDEYNFQVLDDFTRYPLVIGLLKIDKIGLNYPILSYSSDELLKISICRFAGPLPNQVGNLCIGGHNNIDNTFFGKLNQLSIGDKIDVYDLYGNHLTYTLFNKKEILNTDFSCTNQETDGKRIITLVTCNTLKDTRMVYIAQEKQKGAI